MSGNAASEVVLRAVLKQYAFSPKLVKMEVVHRALVKVSNHITDGPFDAAGMGPLGVRRASSEPRQCSHR